MEQSNEQSEKATTSQETEAKAGAADPAQQTVEQFSKEKAVEFIAQVRKERQAAATDAASSKATQSDKTETEKSAAGKEGEAETEGGTANEGTEESQTVFTAEDVAKPGFFDRLSKEEWKALEKQHPSVVAMYKATQSELTRRGQKLAEKERTLTDREKSIETSSKKAAETNASTTVDQNKELEALGFTADDVKKLFGSDVGKNIIREMAKEVLREEGIDSTRSSAQEGGFDLALQAFPQLRDDAVWKEVMQAIQQDQDELDAIETSKDPREIARIIKATAGKIISERSSASATKNERAEKIRDKETKNATQPASKAVGSPRGSNSIDTSKLPMKDQMREHIREQRLAKNYKEVGG